MDQMNIKEIIYIYMAKWHFEIIAGIKSWQQP